MSLGQRLKGPQAPAAAAPAAAPAPKPAAPAAPARPGAAAAAKRLMVVPESKPEKAPRVETPQDARYQELKAKVHGRLFDVLDLSKSTDMTEEKNGEEVMAATQRILGEEGIALTKEERQRLLRDIKDEVFGLGPIEPLLRDADGLRHPGQRPAPGLRRARRQARADRDPLPRRRRTCCRSSSASCRASAGASTSRPRWSTRGSPDGSRVNAIIPPLAIDGPLDLDPPLRRRHARPSTT